MMFKCNLVPNYVKVMLDIMELSPVYAEYTVLTNLLLSEL